MKKFVLRLGAVAIAIALTSSSCDNDPDPVEEPAETTISGEISSDRTWYNDTIYTMSEKVWVTNGATLTIQPGTIIKAEEKSDPTEAVALIVTPGSMIDAEGTASSPIIFTTASDNIDYTTASSLTSDFSGKWGGLVIMGEATCDQGNEPNVSLIEGVASTETRGEYGDMTNDTDNSGILKYVSIRHGGASVSSSSELNGLSLYGVGSGTTIEYIEVFANDDDGIEFFGGTVEVTHALVVHCSDDSFDWDQGFTGVGQFWCSIHANGNGDKGFECDGGEGDLSPNSVPTIGNFTIIGEGTETAVHLKKSTGGKFYNGLIHNFANGFLIDGVTDADLNIDGVVLSNDAGTFAAVYDETPTDLTGASYVTSISNTDLSSLSWAAGEADVIPTATDAASPVTTGSALQTVTYKGAFDPSATTTWATGWTRAGELGIID